MSKVIRSLFLIIIFIGFMYGIAKAESFWVEFIDKSGNGSIDFTVSASSTASQTYYIGVANTDHSNLTQLLEISTTSPNSASVSWSVPFGGSLLYDIYLTDGTNYYWTSEGDASYSWSPGGGGGGGKSSGNKLYTSWLNGAITVEFESITGTGGRDTFAIVPVPLPSALWLLGSGAVALSLIRKKLIFE